MPTDLVMPQLGLTMTEGKILQWYKKPGEAFLAGEPLFEVETDKVNMEVEASEGGTLSEIVAPLDQLLPVTTVIARYLSESEPAPEPAEPERGIISSPRARRAAKKAGINLEGIVGTGPNGRIVEEDVLRIAAIHAPEPAIIHPTPDTAPPAAPAVQTAVPLSRARRITAERTARSFQTAPHFYLTREIDASELLTMKRALSTALARRGSPKLSVTDLLIRGMALTIAAHPGVNASWQDDHIEAHAGIAIGVAIAQDDGLVVPVLRDIANADVTSIARQRSGLVERAHSGRLAASDFGPASATLSNLGMYGVDQFQAILNPPESLILATGRIRDRVVAVNGAPAVRPTMFCTISADHRVLDGAQAARFLADFAESLENPGLLLLPGGEPAA